MTKEQYKNKEKKMNTYEVTWELVIMKEGKIQTCQKTRIICARDFLDALGKSGNLYRCNGNNIVSITFNGCVTEFEDSEVP